MNQLQGVWSLQLTKICGFDNALGQLGGSTGTNGKAAWLGFGSLGRRTITSNFLTRKTKYVVYYPTKDFSFVAKLVFQILNGWIG